MVRIADFSDDFNRADSADLGANWDAGYGLAGGPPTDPGLQVVSARARVAGGSTVCMETVNAATFANDQWAQFTIPTFIGASALEALLLLRAPAPGVDLSGYALGVVLNRTGHGNLTEILRFDAATGDTQLASDTTTWASGDVGLITCVGTVLTVYRNGAVLLTASDATYTSGRVGIGAYNEGSFANLELDDVSAGHFVYDAPIISQELSGSCVGLRWQ